LRILVAAVILRVIACVKMTIFRRILLTSCISSAALEMEAVILLRLTQNQQKVWITHHTCQPFTIAFDKKEAKKKKFIPLLPYQNKGNQKRKKLRNMALLHFFPFMSIEVEIWNKIALCLIESLNICLHSHHIETVR